MCSLSIYTLIKQYLFSYVATRSELKHSTFQLSSLYQIQIQKYNIYILAIYLLLNFYAAMVTQHSTDCDFRLLTSGHYHNTLKKNLNVFDLCFSLIAFVIFKTIEFSFWEVRVNVLGFHMSAKLKIYLFLDR